MTPAERQELIDRYADSLEALRIALFQIGSYGLDNAPPGEWTPRQIVHHLADAEVIRSARFRLILTRTQPHLPSFNEHEFAARQDYGRPLEASLSLLAAAREANLELLRDVADDAWQSFGYLGPSDRYTLEDWLLRAANHCHEHVSQLQSYVRLGA